MKECNVFAVPLHSYIRTDCIKVVEGKCCLTKDDRNLFFRPKLFSKKVLVLCISHYS